jgi:hypothetical protein
MPMSSMESEGIAGRFPERPRCLVVKGDESSYPTYAALLK